MHLFIKSLAAGFLGLAVATVFAAEPRDNNVTQNQTEQQLEMESNSQQAKALKDNQADKKVLSRSTESNYTRQETVKKNKADNQNR